MSSFIDVNHQSRARESFTDLIPETINPSMPVADAYKLSDCHDVWVGNKTIVGGSEDCIDIVRGSKQIWNDITLRPKKNGITIKGAAAEIDFFGLQFTNRGRDQEVEIGQFDNYWYPGRAPTRAVSMRGLGLPAGEGQVRVRLWDAEGCSFDFKSGTEVIVEPRAKWLPYFYFRYAQIRLENCMRKLRGLPPIITK